MSDDRVYKVTELVGTSRESTDAALRNGIDRARTTLRDLAWFEVVEMRGVMGDDGDVDYFQVTLKVGFRLEG